MLILVRVPYVIISNLVFFVVFIIFVLFVITNCRIFALLMHTNQHIASYLEPIYALLVNSKGQDQSISFPYSMHHYYSN